MPSKDLKSYKNLKISDIGEKEIIRRLHERSINNQPTSSFFFDEFYFKSLKDDAALVDLGGNYLAITSDLLTESHHFPEIMSSYEKGMKAVTVNVSDLAAMGAIPMGIVMSMGLPPHLLLEEFDQIIEGVLHKCEDYEMGLMGGDTNESEDLTLCGTCIGIVDKNKVLMKDGGRPGDVVAVTGPLGVAAAGFEIILGSKKLQKSLKESISTSAWELLKKHALQPRAKIKEGILLGDTGAVTSATDITDGLASEVGELIEASNKKIGIRLYEEMIPLLPEVKDIAIKTGKDPLDFALSYGEDFELLLTIQKEDYSRLMDEFGLWQVGVVTDTGKMEIVDKDGKTKILEPKGYQHFK